MKGVSVHLSAYSAGERSVRRGIALLRGMLWMKGVRGVWAHWKGRYRVSEKRLVQGIEVVEVGGMLR